MIGKSILHYKIIEKLGEGGMGVVYLAEDTKLKRQVAIKFLPRQVASNFEERQRFEIEAQAAAALNHPNITHIYAIEETDDDIFIVMEYIEGEELKERLKSDSLQPEEISEMAIKIAEALETAHKKGIVHRDIKSANIMLSDDGRLKIMDFGLAKLGTDHQITKMIATMGTAAYMSPEQANGESVDKRTDIWSFGVVLYEMLTNQLPFKGDYDQAIIYSILNEEPNSVSDLSPDAPKMLVDVINKCLEKDPANRYQSFTEILNDFKFPGNEGKSKSAIFERSESIGSTFVNKIKSKPLISSAAGAFLVVLMLVLFPAGIEKLQSILNISSIPDKQHLLVLPVTNIGGDESKQAFCDGLVETLTSKLSQMEQYHGSLWVVPSSEVRRHNISSPSEAHQSFGVNLAVTGSLQILQDILRLTLNLIDADNMRQINSSVIDVNSSELSKLQDNSVVKLLEMLNLELNPKAEKLIREGETTVPGAYDLYVQGRGYLLRYENDENIDIAIRLFHQAIEQDSLYALAHAALAESFWRKYVTIKDTAYVGKAHQACETALKLNDQLAPVNVTMGIIHTGTGEYKDAIDFFNIALSSDPKNAEAYRGLAKAYEAQGLLDESESTYKRAINLKPDYWGGYNDLGVFYYRNSRYEEAINQFRQVTILTPDNYKGYNNLGGIFYLLERWEEAREMFDRSFQLRKSYNVASNLGTLNYIEGRYLEAAKMYEAALEINDHDYRVWGNLAAAYFWSSGKRELAINYYKDAIQKAEEQKKINPKDPDLLSDLASYYAEIGERVKSIELIDKSLELAPGNAYVLFRTASTYERLGERGEALNWIRKALDNGYSKSEIEHQPELKELIADERYQNLFGSTQTDN